MDKAEAYRLLLQFRPLLNKQQYRTISGQINAGDTEGAIRGLMKLSYKEQSHANKGTNPPRAGQ